MDKKGKKSNLGVNRIDAITKDAVQKLQENKNGIAGISTGFEKLDNVLSGFKEGDVYTIGGRPSMGKTSFAISLIDNIAVKQHVPTLLFSMECNVSRCTQRLLANHCDIPLSKIYNALLEPEDWDRLDKQVADIIDSSIYVDDSAFMTIDDIQKKAREYVDKYGIKLIFIDYLQLIYTSYRANRTRNDDVAEIMHGIKAIARELSIPIILLSQLNRSPENRPSFSSLEEKRPKLSDLRDSGTIEEDSDAIIFVHRPEVCHIYTDDHGRDLHNMAQIIIEKNRTGRTGEILLRFDGEYCKFSEQRERSMSSEIPPIDDSFSANAEAFLNAPLPY